MDCNSCDYVTRADCERRHDLQREKEEKQDDIIYSHDKTLAVAMSILERTPIQQPVKKSFWETSSGKVVIYGAVGLVLVVVSYALGAKNVEQILNALPK